MSTNRVDVDLIGRIYRLPRDLDRDRVRERDLVRE